MKTEKLHERMHTAALTGTDVTLDGPEAADMVRIIEGGLDCAEAVGDKSFWQKFNAHVAALKEYKDRYK
jgi:hypothetical protein